MKIAYILATCSTCNRVINEIGRDKFDKIINIKENPISADELDNAKQDAGSYEALFNKRAMKFRAIKNEIDSADDMVYRELILGEYTFMKRPLFNIDNKYFAGYAKKVIAEVESAIEKSK